jgi:hypothetical protein
MRNLYALGTAHRRRAEAAALITQRRNGLDDAGLESSRSRWVDILAAIRRIVATYNDGAGREVLVVTGSDGSSSATIESEGCRISALVVTLDEGEIRVECRGTAPHHDGIKRWIAMTRTDNEMAAYALQEWMERL